MSNEPHNRRVSDEDIEEIEKAMLWKFTQAVGWKGLVGIVAALVVGTQMYLSWQDWKVLLSEKNITEFNSRGIKLKDHERRILVIERTLIGKSE
jgi:hypothetical protein